MVSRRTASACSMRRSDHPSRPSARTCCCLSLSKTLLMTAREHAFLADVNVSIAIENGPVFSCRLMAGFGCAPRVHVMRIATGEIQESLETDDGKNKAAVELGRKGGNARAAALSAKRRRQIATKAASAR